MSNELSTTPRERIDYLPTMREIIMAREFPDEEMCVQMIMRKTWGREPKCTYDGCNGRLGLGRKTKGSWYVMCSSNPRHATSPFTGTLYASTATSILKWFEAVDIIYRTDNRVDNTTLAKKLGVTYTTAQVMRKKIIIALSIRYLTK